MYINCIHNILSMYTRFKYPLIYHIYIYIYIYISIYTRLLLFLMIDFISPTRIRGTTITLTAY